MIRAGTLRHRVSIQKYEDQLNPITGARDKNWVEVSQVWASIEPLSVRDFIQSAGLQSQVSARISIRYRDDITAGMRIVHRNKIYSITGVLSDRNSGLEYLTLPCTEGANAG